MSSYGHGHGFSVPEIADLGSFGPKPYPLNANF